jgi:alpha-tubulin suppressor-like RCC1 family protein
VLKNTKTIQIATGYFHSVLVSDSGIASAFGSNIFGELGDGTETSSNSLVTVSFPLAVAVTFADVGSSFSVFLTKQGAVYTVGKNDLLQLGDNTTVKFRNTPVPIVDANNVLASKTVDKIAAGYAHTLLLSSDAKLFAYVNTDKTLTIQGLVSMRKDNSATTLIQIRTILSP